MSLKGWVAAVVVVVAISYTFVFQNPLFEADFNSMFSNGPPQVQVTAFLPAGQPGQWSYSGLSYSCAATGPGVLQVANGGNSDVTVVSVSLTYGGQIYSAAGPDCPAAHGNTLVSITALGAPPGGQGSAYSGYVTTLDGEKVSFSGTWQ